MSSPVKTYSGDCYAKIRASTFKEKGPSFKTSIKDLSTDAQVALPAETNPAEVKAALLAICKTNAENYSGRGIVKSVFVRSITDISGQ